MAEPTTTLDLGDPAYGSDVKSVTYEAGEAITAGDVVAIASDTALQADDTTNTDDFGIAGEDGADGDNITVYTEGPVVANVASSATTGPMTLSATAGQLDNGAGDYTAITNEGGASGLSIGFNIPANGAVVNF